MLPEVYIYIGRQSSKHPPTNNKQPLLLPLRPLDNLIRPLRHDLARDIRPRDTIKLKHRRDPGQTGGVFAHAVEDLEVGVARVHGRVQVLVERHESAAGDHFGEGRVEGGHAELDVCAGLVEEVADLGAGGDGGDFGTAFLGGGFDDGQAAGFG